MSIKHAAIIVTGMLACLVVAGPVTASGQSSSAPKTIQITRGARGQKVVYGKATHYSRILDGTKTAIGTRYSNSKLTAASNFFKLRTWVRVTRLSNGRSVIVYINDRMHWSMAGKGRVIDLSVAAAEKLRFMGLIGIARVKIEQITAGEAQAENQKPAK